MTRLATAIVAGVLFAGCGYSESEMQSQRDKSTILTEALDQLAADNALLQATLTKTAAQNAALSSALLACPQPEPGDAHVGTSR